MRMLATNMIDDRCFVSVNEKKIYNMQKEKMSYHPVEPHPRYQQVFIATISRERQISKQNKKEKSRNPSTIARSGSNQPHIPLTPSLNRRPSLN